MFKPAIFIFQNHTLKPHYINNQIWFESKELAKALNYTDTKAVTRIYHQYSAEFITGMSEVTESTTSTKAPNLKTRTRIFSLRGAHLIAMFARTPVAGQFRKWVLDLIDINFIKLYSRY